MEAFDPKNPVNQAGEFMRQTTLLTAEKYIRETPDVTQEMLAALVLGTVTAAAGLLLSMTTERKRKRLDGVMQELVRQGLNQALGIEKAPVSKTSAPH